MFQFKSSGLSIKEPDNSSALPNNFGKVRTFKEDLENFKKKGADKENNEDFLLNSTPSQETERSLEKQSFSPATPANANGNKIPDNNPFQSVPMPSPLSSPESDFSNLKSAPSQSFFAENPPAPDNILPENKKEEPATPKKNKSKLVVLIFVIFIAAAGASFYYYWFYFKNNPSLISQTPANQTSSSAENAASISSNLQGNNLQRLIIDTEKSPLEIKNAVSKLTTEFAASSAENDLIEIKVISQDNQPIGKKDFLSGFGLTIPETVLAKLSESYSLFLKKEGGTAKLGIVFKTITSSGLNEEMKKWESNMATSLKSLYLEKVSAPAEITFNSSQYKNADIRYFNFSSPLNFSLDYSIISNFLVIGTSKDSMRSILDYMAKK